MADERAERLRKRRKRSNQSVQRPTEPEQQEPRSQSTNGQQPSTQVSEDQEAATEGDASSEDADADETDTSENGSVKEERTGTYMYLPEDQLKDLKRRYNVLKAEYEFEYDEEFEKNRHFYPLVIQHGLDGLDDLDISELRDAIQEI